MELVFIGILMVITVGLVIVTLTSIHKINSLSNKLNQTEEIKQQVNQQGNVSLKTQGLVETIQKQINDLNRYEIENSIKVKDTFRKVDDLSKIMVNQKSRGNYGEYQLSSIMAIYCGESQSIYSMQYRLQNNMIVDCALKTPGDDKIIGIDAKFPLENYQRIIDQNSSDELLDTYQARFSQNIKKHIQDIANKYITMETQPYAIMFVPSEAIYQYIASEHPDLIEYGHKRKVLLVSPTTLLGVVFTIINLTKDLHRSKHTKEIERNIVRLKDDIDRLVERHNRSLRQLDTLKNSLEETNKSITKIDNLVNKVVDGYVEEEEELLV